MGDVRSSSRGRIIVFGIMFWYPLAGVTYQFLHYLLGLRALGYDVWYVEDSARWVYDPDLNDLTPDASSNVRTVAPVLDRFGFGDRWVFRGAYEGGRCYGLDEAQLSDLYRTADAFLNVTGAQELRDDHLRIPRRIYVQSDPFADQVKVAIGDAGTIETLDAHDTHFTFGESIGTPLCDLPAIRYTWLPTRQPVAIELWANDRQPDPGRYTTIATWQNTGKDVIWNGVRYQWTKDTEFRRFLELPELRPAAFELASDPPPDDRLALQSHGWHLADPARVSTRLDDYRKYIQGSRAEFTVSKEQVVKPRTGWFSDRSASYLAAGRPVVTHDTGFGAHLPTGLGLFAFSTMADILDAVDQIESDYAQNSAAAREIAAEYFGAEKVLSSLMQRAGL